MQVFLTPMHLAIAMEYAKGGNLFHYLLQHGPHCRLTEAKAQWIFQQLIIGLDYCHRRVRPATSVRMGKHNPHLQLSSSHSFRLFSDPPVQVQRGWLKATHAYSSTTAAVCVGQRSALTRLLLGCLGVSR